MDANNSILRHFLGGQMPKQQRPPMAAQPGPSPVQMMAGGMGQKPMRQQRKPMQPGMTNQQRIAQMLMGRM